MIPKDCIATITFPGDLSAENQQKLKDCLIEEYKGTDFVFETNDALEEPEVRVDTPKPIRLGKIDGSTVNLGAIVATSVSAYLLRKYYELTE